VITLPDGPLTYTKALDTIGKQLKIHVGHEPNMPELSDNCLAHGPMTFKQFFEPLKAKGLTFQFVTDYLGKLMLIIKRAPFAPSRGAGRETFGVWVTDGDDEPLSNVVIENLNTGEFSVTDSSGRARFLYTRYPVQLYCTHVSLKPACAPIIKDNMKIVLLTDPQSLAAATVSYMPKPRAISTNDYSAIRDDAASYPYNGAIHHLSGISTATVQSMLEGQMPGVLPTPSSGMPGSSSYLVVRGQASMVNGIDPLYVIDGVPAAAGNGSVSYIQTSNAGGSLSAWSFVAPSDIERIDVLRDADATAIYGSRGANGVILITTRHWTADLPRLDIESSTGASDVFRQPSFMNTREYLATRREALQNSGLTPNTTNAPDLTLLDTTRNVNWGKWLLGRPAPLTNVRLALSGGEKKNNYTVGLNYLRESTPFPTQPGHERRTGNFNYNHQSANRRWALQLAGLAGWDVNHQWIAFDPTAFRLLAPDAPAPLDKNGRLNFLPGVPYFNPMSLIRQPYEAGSANYLLSMVNSYAIVDNLSCKAIVGVNRIQAREFGASPLVAQNPAEIPIATGYFATTDFLSRIFEPELEYKYSMGKLVTSWLGGISLQSLVDNADARTDTGYVNDVVLLQQKHAIVEDTLSQRMRDDYTAYYTNLNANWNDQYILNLTARKDGSSRFPAGHRFGNFGAVAFAWVFSNGDLLHKRKSLVSYGKLKFSAGVTGNNQVGDRSLNYFANTYVEFASIAGLYPTTPTGQGWEKTYKTELSLDLGFLRDRIFLNLTAYRHHSDNLLQTGMIPAGTGASGYPMVLENTGFEGSLSAMVVDNRSFGWDVSLNWTVPANKLVSFPLLNLSPFAGRLVVGQSINVLKGYVFTGVNRQTGLYTFADLNGDGRITNADQKVLGKFDVTGFGGIESIVRWRQFQFQVLLDARIATGVNYLATVFANNPPGSIDAGLSSNLPRVLLDHWRQPGDKAQYQKVTAAPDAGTDSTMALYLNSNALFSNASFVRVRKVSFVYSLPPMRTLALHLTTLAFFVNAQNLFVFSRYKADPEIQSLSTMPTMRTVEAGIRLSL
jgi:TonB-dependent starch-binding outer membrane protein SusC